MHKRNVKWITVAILLVSLLLLTACGGAGEIVEENENGVEAPEKEVRTDLIWGAVQDPDSLDPRLTTSAYAEEVLELVFNSLVYPDENLEMQFDLATGLETPDDTTYIFTLREDVTWHDGEPFTSADVVFTYESIMDEDFGSPHRTRTFIASVEALDEYTVKLTTEEPNAAALSSLRRFIVPKHLAPSESYEGGEGSFAFNPIGTGPYKLTQWIPNNVITLERYEDYFEGPAILETIVRREIPEDETRYAELLAGNIDLAQPPERELDTLADNPKFTVEISQTLNYFPIAINHDHKEHDILNDVRVRQALNYAIDKETIVSHIWPTASVMHNPIVAGTWAYDDNATYKYSYNPDRAKELLEEAGYGEGLTLSITMSNSAANIQLGEMLRSYYAEVGIDLKADTMEFSSALSKILDGDFELYHMGSTGMYDPHDFMSRFINGTGVTAYNNPEFNALVEEAVTIIGDLDARKELYSQAQEIMTTDAYNIPLRNSQMFMAWNKDFQFDYNYVIRSRNLKHAYWK
ncbi:MAG: ABC transporter substrate-binding protein [Clostridiaceae bacterium]|nr:ABC transporter substrate-binding protein [Clostridiaceae bacterium]